VLESSKQTWSIMRQWQLRLGCGALANIEPIHSLNLALRFLLELAAVVWGRPDVQ
jgi:hypothetical protein